MRENLLMLFLIVCIVFSLNQMTETPEYVPPKQPTEQERIEHRKKMKKYGEEQTWCVNREKDGSMWFKRKSDGKWVEFK